MVRLLLILSQVPGLASQQVDYTASFVHAPIQEEVYFHMPRGFSEPEMVLKLKHSLYRLKQSLQNCFHYLKGNLELCRFRNLSPDTDSGFFISDKVVCVAYADDTLLRSPKSKWIEEAVSQLTATGMTNGDPPDGSFNYASIIGMLGYLQANSCLDITFAISALARFTHSPRSSHKEALKRIVHYLKGTLDEGLVQCLGETLNINFYVNADVAGLWPQKYKLDLTCTKSRTGFAICGANCPVIWSSKLQGVLLTPGWKLSTCVIIGNARAIATTSVNYTIDWNQNCSNIKNTTSEENAGALSLVKLELSQMPNHSMFKALCGETPLVP
ncbi:reverse transcriptase RNA-dependent DNA polymerase [Nitzschia inconspicua]|uniref:Reverse transcriptase RNA-dependent DNA polymerase n=1 Tax=Nitzschia inconspicua TaxID=303405 RepID=A0A9K3KMS2_9STRA|nr:reverse transcriptase RNA-dependent DNA polymerase [Nitzschia inconspicua]